MNQETEKKLSTVNKKQKTSDCVCAQKIKKKKCKKRLQKVRPFDI